ncbi:MAG: hypothetical protein FWD28_04515 [Treponema sp.]|nr:hypothetical protein [Treponema sp.]
MRKYFLFSILFIFLATVAWGDVFEWIGGSGSNWNTPANWNNITSGTPVPATRAPNGTGDTAIINALNQWGITLTSNITLDVFEVNAQSTYNFNGNTLNVNRFIVNESPQIQVSGGTGRIVATTTEMNALIQNDYIIAPSEISTVNLIIAPTVARCVNNLTMDGAVVHLDGGQNFVRITKTAPGENLRIGSVNVGDGNRLEVSSAGNITFTGDITAQRLFVNANAGAGNVTVNGSVNINTATAAAVPSVPGHIACGTNPNNVSICVQAHQFRAYGGSGVINPVGQMCLRLNTVSAVPGGYLISTGKIAGTPARFHFYGAAALTPVTFNDRSLVFYNSNIQVESAVDARLPAGTKHFVDVSTLTSSETYRVQDPYNIYIISASNTGNVIQDDFDFIIEGSGRIEFYDNYISAGALNLSPGANGIRLNSAGIRLDNSNFDTTNIITLAGAGASSINARGINLGAVTGTSSNDFDLTANGGIITLGGAVSNIRNLNVTAPLININADINTPDGDHNYVGAISLGGIGNRSITARLVTTSGTVSGNRSLTITNSYDITIGAGGVNLGAANTLTLNSATASIYINGNIANINRLLITAPDGTVYVPDGVSIIVQSSNNHAADGAINITADTFSVAAGTGQIRGGTGATVCHNLVSTFDNSSNRVVNFCADCTSGGGPISKNIVFGSTASAPSSFNDAAGNPITFTPANFEYYEFSAIGNEVYEVDGAHNIYFLNAGINNTLTSAAQFKVENGYIDIIGDYTAPVFPMNSDVVRLRAANINLGANNLNADTVTVSLPTVTTNNITAANIRFGEVIGNGTLNVTGNINILDTTTSHNITLDVTGSASFGPDNLPGPDLPENHFNSISVSNTITVRGPIITAGNQTYNNVLLFSNTSNLALRTLTGTNVTINGSVTHSSGAGTVALRVDGNAEFNSTFTVRHLEVTGTTRINGNITTVLPAAVAADGVQTYHGNVTIANNVTLTAPANRAINFNGTVNGAGAGAQSLTIATANAWFGQAVGGTAALSSLSVAGTTQINAGITTTAAQTYTGNVTLGANLTFNAGTALNFGGTVNGAVELTITCANVTFGGAVGAGTALTSINISASASGITLDNAANNIGALQITGAGGAVSFRTTGALAVNGITGLTGGTPAAQNVTVIAVGNITSNGTITSTGTVRLESVSGNIVVDGAISSNRLLLMADNDPVTGNTITINPAIIIDTSNAGAVCGEATASIYVRAEALIAAGASVTITPGTAGAGILCVCDVIDTSGLSPQRVFGTPPRICFNFKDLVFGRNINPADFPAGANIIDLNAIPPPTLNASYTVSDGRTIFLVDLTVFDDVTSFIIVGGGFIEIRGDYSPTNVTLNPGASGIRLNNADIDLTGATVSAFTPGPITLIGTGISNTITATSVTMNTIVGNGNDLNIESTTAAGVTFSDDVTQANNLRHLTVTTATGTINVNANITTTGNQTYNGNVALGGVGAGARVFTGGAGFTVQFSNNINATRQLTVERANVRFHGNVNVTQIAVGTAAVNVTTTFSNNAATITTTIATANTQAQRYRGNVILERNVTFVGAANTIIRFNAEVNSNADGANSLTVQTANVRFTGQVGGLPASSTTRLSSVTVNHAAASNTRVEVGVNTTGGQDYYGLLMLGVQATNIVFKANPGSLIEFRNTVNSFNATFFALTITDANVTFIGNVGNTVTSLNVNNGGTTTIHGNITTSGIQTYTGPLVLAGTAGTTRILTGTTITMGEISASTAVPADRRSLTITGNAVFNGADNDGIVNLLVSGTVTFNNAVSTSITTTGTVTFNQTAEFNFTSIINNGGIYTQLGAVTVNSIFRQTGAGGVTLGAGVNTLTLLNAVKADAEISFASAVTLTAPDDTLTFNAPATGGFVELRSGLANSDYTLVLNGGGTAAGASFDFSQTSGTLGDVTITANSNVLLRTGAIVTQANGKKLTLGNAAVLDVSLTNSSWHVGTGATRLYDFAGVNGNMTDGGLVLDVNSRLIANNINFNNVNFSINNTARAVISAKGNVSIGANIGMPNYLELVLEMIGNGTLPNSTQNLSVNAARALGRLHVRAGSLTNLTSSLVIDGEVEIQYSASFPPVAPFGVLDAQGFNIVLRAGFNETKYGNSANVGRWRVINGPIDGENPILTMSTTSHAFVQTAAGSVTFDRINPSDTNVFFEVIGNTIWRNFNCSVPGATIQFSTDSTAFGMPDHHVFLGSFSVKVTGSSIESERITLTRYIDHSIGGRADWLHIYDNPSITPPNRGLPPAVYPVNLKANTTERAKFWNFNIEFVSQLDVEHVRMYFSHTWNIQIPIDDTLEQNLKALPYYAAGIEGYFNYDWLPRRQPRSILYSFTEDFDGDGRLDRIRVQTRYLLNGNFGSSDSDFLIRVEGYTIDVSRGTRGYQMVSDWLSSVTPGSPEITFNRDSFYIYLEQKIEIDGGAAPRWSIINNTVLRDSEERRIVGVPGLDINIRPIDTIPPRVMYTLTLPGTAGTDERETYVKISKPVENAVFDRSPVTPIEGTSSYTFTWQFVSIDGVVKNFSLPVAAANTGYLLQQNPLGIGVLSGLNNITNGIANDSYFRIDSMVDQGRRALDWTDPAVFPEDPLEPGYYNSPKYPTNWRYTQYARVTGNGHLTSLGLSGDQANALTGAGTIPIADVFLPPHRVLNSGMLNDLASGNGQLVTASRVNSENNIRRVTDILVSIPPASSSDSNYFAWPVYARSLDDPRNDGDERLDDPDIEFGTHIFSDMALIWEFDGTKYLEECSMVDIQIRTNTGMSAPNMFYGFNVPLEDTSLNQRYRNPAVPFTRGNSAGGLWMPRPETGINSTFHLVPNFFAGFITASPPVSSNPQLFTFTINTSAFLSREGKFEFLIKLGGVGAAPYLPVARLDIPRGAAVPANWYRLVRPFSFDIQNMSPSVGGVTIMNNVINSDNREVTYLRYVLTRPGRVTIQVHTLDGTLVRSLKRNEHHEAGEWTVGWDGSNNSGRPVARGMYFIRVVGPDIDEIRKVMVVR